MMKGSLRGMAIAGALTTLLSGGVAFAAKAGKAGGAVHCDGTNDCKGKGSCKSAKNDCKGKNGCKGQSFTNEKDAKACTDKGGTVATAEKK